MTDNREEWRLDDATLRLVEEARGVTEWMALHVDAQEDARKVDAALDALLAKCKKAKNG